MNFCFEVILMAKLQANNQGITVATSIIQVPKLLDCYCMFLVKSEFVNRRRKSMGKRRGEKGKGKRSTGLPKPGIEPGTFRSSV